MFIQEEPGKDLFASGQCHHRSGNPLSVGGLQAPPIVPQFFVLLLNYLDEPTALEALPRLHGHLIKTRWSLASMLSASFQ